MLFHPTQLILLFAIFLVANTACYGKPPDEIQQYIQALHGHKKNRSFSAISDDFRDRLKKDIDGTLIGEILKNPDLRGMLFANFDAAPDIFIDLILAEHLTDKSQWESKGGLFHSPAGGVAAFIRDRFKIQDTESLLPSGALDYVLLDKEMRSEISKVFRELSSGGKIPPTMSDERRNAARGKIILIVNDSYYRLADEDNRSREKYRSDSPSDHRPDEKSNSIQNQISIKSTKQNLAAESVQQKIVRNNFSWLWCGIFLSVIGILVYFLKAWLVKLIS